MSYNITLVIEIPLKTRYDNTNDAACFEKKWGKDMDYQYLVQVETIVGEMTEETFNTRREALCYATNYAKVKMSKVFRSGEILHEFNY